MNELAVAISKQLVSKTAQEKASVLRGLIDDLPETEKAVVARSLGPILGPPKAQTRDRIWLIVISAFALVLVGSAAVLGIGVFSTATDATKQITKSDTILTVFTTVVGFLSGLLAPSPLGGKQE
ncbi:MAG: hypothetical protein F9K29_02860 [Hyphomicrobiaceae bacterium]|nr:MAG: hypothetical protein F9K29_02860 [Hyphomicrobiaceae bacterium]